MTTSSVRPTERVICALPTDMRPVARVRGIALVLSVAAIRRAGFEAEYASAASPAFAERMRNIVPTDWVPVDVAVEHYRVLDRVIANEQERLKLGHSAGAGAHGTVVGVLARALRATQQPVLWKVLERFDMIWSRLADGGGAEVRSISDRQARIVFHGLPIADLGYVRTAFQGHIEINVRTLEPTARVSVLQYRNDGLIHFNVTWGSA